MKAANDSASGRPGLTAPVGDPEEFVEPGSWASTLRR
jgi:hypothetical protein